MAEKTHRPGEVLGGAPTAPHARQRPVGAPESGPERFWTHRHPIVVVAAWAISIGLHALFLPGSLLPEHVLEFHDVDGTLSIPIDLLKTESPTPEESLPPPPPPVQETKAPLVAGPAAAPSVMMRQRDAGLDSGDADAEVRSHTDAKMPDTRDAGDATASPFEEGGIASVEDAAAPSGSARDAVGMIGAAGNVQAGPQNVVLTVNTSVIRAHPASKRLGLLLAAVPQWEDFLAGTGVDPLRDIDWISINGPALLHTEKDVILVRYSAPDAVVDKAVGVLAAKTAQGGPTKVGVPGVRAVRGYADRAERIFLRPQPHVLAVVPAFYAKTAAEILSKAIVPRVLARPAEALRLTLVHPHGPMPGVPESVREIRIWLVPRNADGGADVYGEAVTADAEGCKSAAGALARLIDDQNSIGVQILTHGLLNHVEIEMDRATVRLHLAMTRDQIDIVLAFVGGRLGVDMTPEADDASAPDPRAPRR